MIAAVNHRGTNAVRFDEDLLADLVSYRSLSFSAIEVHEQRISRVVNVGCPDEITERFPHHRINHSQVGVLGEIIGITPSVTAQLICRVRVSIPDHAPRKDSASDANRNIGCVKVARIREDGGLICLKCRKSRRGRNDEESTRYQVAGAPPALLIR